MMNFVNKLAGKLHVNKLGSFLYSDVFENSNKDAIPARFKFKCR